jgi:hypothetical protein
MILMDATVDRSSLAPVAGTFTLPVQWVASEPHSAVAQPITAGIALPQGAVWPPVSAWLSAPGGDDLYAQAEPLAKWPDGSIQWLLMDAVLPAQQSLQPEWTLHLGPRIAPEDRSTISVRREEARLIVETEAAQFDIDTTTMRPWRAISLADASSPQTRHSANQSRFVKRYCSKMLLRDAKGRSHEPRLDSATIETQGPVRTTICLEGHFPRLRGIRVQTRLSFYSGTGLVKVDVTLHNSKRARHRGGLWDLGDRGSLLFREFSVYVSLLDRSLYEVVYQAEPHSTWQAIGSSPLEIYQDSSGGENWRSRNHVNRHGVTPCSFRGYRLTEADRATFGQRAEPLVSIMSPAGTLALAVREFWQQFPSALAVRDGEAVIGLFPHQCTHLVELQGGERKTHTFWLHVTPEPMHLPHPLSFTSQTLALHTAPAALPQLAGLLPVIHLPPGEVLDRLDSYLGECLDGPHSLFAKREQVDEYGWRNYGDIFADHERTYYRGSEPLVSHYNNQFDMVYGFLLHYLRTGDPRWWQLGDALARHVLDIDLYHTQRDRPAYNGGLFWFTDHYTHAETSTHRTYSRRNTPRFGRRHYGGGPNAQHNFTTGLLLYSYLTGHPAARAGVIQLADWVVNMDDGRRTRLAPVDAGPTGLATATGSSTYHGPGRAGGNSLSALLDAWALTGKASYLAYAEELIRRCIHPSDDIAARDLLDVERRWSYTVFLAALSKYLEHKESMCEHDATYCYAQAALLHYGRWMLRHEIPYFDQVEKLEFPTETWAAQDLRKANVLRLAARHADEPLRTRMYDRGDELADRAWHDLLRFPQTRTCARAMAIVMVEGLCDIELRLRRQKPPSSSLPSVAFGGPAHFAGQRERVLARMKSLRGMMGLAARLLSPTRRKEH